ncbi:hypothetical protein E2C01_091666 [Portunus trituberculatus]|uniref:Uncharacterized protein n=1 Tax=Portunus trituberculatus TaxID=210409 RepID=A0A5B7JTI7_PORTR|nr:hypothetical protein [Portunus trituberculatus]
MHTFFTSLPFNFPATYGKKWRQQKDNTTHNSHCLHTLTFPGVPNLQFSSLSFPSSWSFPEYPPLSSSNEPVPAWCASGGGSRGQQAVVSRVLQEVLVSTRR